MAEVEATNVETLSELFNKGLDLYNEINKSEEPTNSPALQANIQKAREILEQSTRLVSYAGIFSRNEGINEVATNDLQYFLLPALLGSLVLKTTGERKEVIETAEIYFKDFLTRCHDYNLTDFKIDDKQIVSSTNRTPAEAIMVAASTRENKIQRFKQQKELKSKLEDLKKNVENEHVDEDIKRDYFLTMIKSSIFEAIEELNSIEMEKPILEHMAKMKKDGSIVTKPPQPLPRLKPIIITRDEVQKAVYGAGYPSLPTMTVQEFYDKRVKDGVFPDPNKQPSTSSLSLQQRALLSTESIDDENEQEVVDKEKRIEDDDPELLERMRQMDEFKDDHRRGWGNRMNRS